MLKRHFALALVCISTVITVSMLNACRDDDDDDDNNNPTDTLSAYLTPIASSTQRTGNPELGRDYLVYGDYVNHGVPYNIYAMAFGNGDGNLLQREGDNANVRYDYTALTAPNGVRVVAPNCLQCHAQTLNGELIVGLGNSTANFTTDQSFIVNVVDGLINNLYGNPSPQWDAYEPFRRATLAIAPYVVTKVRGTNAADNLAAVLAAHRDPDTFVWQDNPQISIPELIVPVDVPAWWLLRKKNAMFHNAMGRGDYAKISMASGLLTLVDTAQARQINEHFADVIAYLNTIEPPAYPQAVNTSLAAEGKTIFQANCQRCHGSYGEIETYPNLVVSLDVVKTDPTVVEGFASHGSYIDWYNESWFNKPPFAAQLTPAAGYIAPPLDGIWATAPYLHNGSVPTLDDLLNSTQRPTYWARSYNTDDYDYTKLGWNYAVQAGGGSSSIYDTTLEGYGNQGHTFGDHLTTTERQALLEYLKTL